MALLKSDENACSDHHQQTDRIRDQPEVNQGHDGVGDGGQGGVTVPVKVVGVSSVFLHRGQHRLETNSRGRGSSISLWL